MKVVNPLRTAALEQIISTCDRRGIKGLKVAALLQAHGYESSPGRQFTRQRISQIRLRARDLGNRIIVASGKLEDEIRTNATLLRMAAQNDERAERYYRAYEDALLETGCPLRAFAEVKREALAERAERKAVEAAEAEVVAVQVVSIHSNGKIGS